MLGMILTELSKIQGGIDASESLDVTAQYAFMTFSDAIDQSGSTADERECFTAGFVAGHSHAQDTVRDDTVRSLAAATAWMLAAMTRLNTDTAEVGAILVDESRKLVQSYAAERVKANRQKGRALSSVHVPSLIGDCNLCPTPCSGCDKWEQPECTCRACASA